ncbi:MAG: hypothetical protein SGPRY_008955, partial [Prymnesium sp.]
CKGCDWCHKSAGQAGTCASQVQDDILFPDCQDFCSADSWSEHCKLCKCRACSFCGCEPKDADDSTEQQCEPWCTADYYEDHCSRCKCKGCDFCHAGGPPCSPATPDDINFKACQEFCSADFIGTHCGLCKCAGCDFCSGVVASGVVAGSCTSGVADDVSVEMCQPFCDPRDQETHCELCKCRGCEFCKCESRHEGDSKLEECQKWCDADLFDDHCSWCSCKGCGFCRAGGKACQSFFAFGDIDHEDCESFCSADSADEHCAYCKCKRCPFCKAAARKALAPRPPPAPLPSSSGPPCFSGRGGDTNFETCEGFCSKEEQTEHCKLCKCRGCAMCSASCESGIAGDSLTKWCSSTCHAEQAQTYCPLCKCRGCHFCNSDGTPSGAVALPTDAEGACSPANSKDLDHAACLGHCTEENKVSHCETCKCKGCDFCKGYEACNSGKKGDTRWVECDKPWCTSALHDRRGGEGQACSHCRCRGCEECKTAASIVEDSQPCTSGILFDVDYTACLPGVCLPDLAQAHCQTCRCKGCGFCVKLAAASVSPPPPRPPLIACTPVSNDDFNFESCEAFCTPAHAARDCMMCKCKGCSFCFHQAKPCSSHHIADAKVEKCGNWCEAISLPKSVVCSFCFCKGCEVCKGFEVTKSVVVHSYTKCLVGIEMIVVSARPDSNKNWHYAARLRLSKWQAGGLVKIDFRGQNIELDSNNVENAVIKGKENGAYTFVLGKVGDQMRAFALDFKIIRDGLDMASGPNLECSNFHEVPPSRPSPPPPPFLPFFRSPPPPPPGYIRTANACPLGGKVIILSRWAGGASFRAQVVMAIWRPGSEVVLNFASVLEEASSVAGMFVSHASNADLLEPPVRGAVRVRLSSTPGDAHDFSLVGHGGEIHDHPDITCRVAGQIAAPPAPLAARIGPSCGPMGLSYVVTQHWAGGFRAVVAIAKWQAGAQISFDFSGSFMSLIDSYAATRDPTGNGITFILAEKPDEEHHGFGFSMRGDFTVVPSIDCKFDSETLGMRAVPAATCGMGIAFSVHPREQDPARGGGTIRLRVHQWTPMATVTVTFSTKVEVKAVSSMAKEQSNALGVVHTFLLGSHPDLQHGFDFKVLSTSAVQVQRVSCRPPPSNTPVEAEDTKVGSPDAPTELKASGNLCDSFKVKWKPAVDNGFSVTGHALHPICCSSASLSPTAHPIFGIVPSLLAGINFTIAERMGWMRASNLRMLA